MQRSCLWSVIGRRNLDEHVFDVTFRVFDDDVKVAVVIEHTGVD
jgi:hypothetical protein